MSQPLFIKLQHPPSKRIHSKKGFQFPLMPTKYVFQKPEQRSEKRWTSAFDGSIVGNNCNRLQVQSPSQEQQNDVPVRSLAKLESLKPSRIDPKMRETFSQFKKVVINMEELKQLKNISQRKKKQSLKPIKQNFNHTLRSSTSMQFLKEDLKYLHQQDNELEDIQQAKAIMNSVMKSQNESQFKFMMNKINEDFENEESMLYSN